ncbi:aldo/keto reductase [Alkalicoccus daliensis]|uniref:Predicted oxidoreductase n=1 Tax=Alkalicoccus daliensis TaxID=745820 RepID=A0A1H0BI43_9BACI|nr:aldo/keto reductase [Alkalicoccus daliensis]SDN45083.1 Predicted oxidoreductase [Alkalicoccus daliensis]
MKSPRRKLGLSDLELSPVGLGCWQFSKGSNTIGKYWDTVEDNEMQEIVKKSLEGGINWFDTAEIYGKGASERGLAFALDNLEVTFDEAKIATKWWPALRKASNILHSIEARKDALNQRPIELYQIHQPFSFSSIDKQMEAMSKLMRDGHIKNIGISNFSEKAMRKAHASLQNYGSPLISNQMKYSLLDRRIESNGFLKTAKELDIAVIAYSPLEQGLLTGKFHDNPEIIKGSSGPRKWMNKFKENGLQKTAPLIKVLQKYAEKYGVSVSQVVLNWMIYYHGENMFVIPGASKVKQAEDNAGAMSFKLSEEELEDISEASWRVQLY